MIIKPKNYSIIVTFNGSCFDIPFLERYFATTIKCAQIDLRFVLKDLGFKILIDDDNGILKEVDKKVKNISLYQDSSIVY